MSLAPTLALMLRIKALNCPLMIVFVPKDKYSRLGDAFRDSF